jgi:hypothetical protein
MDLAQPDALHVIATQSARSAMPVTNSPVNASVVIAGSPEDNVINASPDFGLSLIVEHANATDTPRFAIRRLAPVLTVEI